jgi:hypothetical protein
VTILSRHFVDFSFTASNGRNRRVLAKIRRPLDGLSGVPIANGCRSPLKNFRGPADGAAK